MLVKDIMTRNVKSISPDTKLQEAAALMCLNRFTSLPVVENDILIGILAERDVLSYLFPRVEEFMEEGMSKVDFESHELDYKKVLPLKAADLMTKGVIFVAPSTPLLKAVAVMARHNLRRIPIAEMGKLVGIVSLGDIHRAIFLESFASR